MLLNRINVYRNSSNHSLSLASSDIAFGVRAALYVSSYITSARVIWLIMNQTEKKTLKIIVQIRSVLLDCNFQETML